MMDDTTPQVVEFKPKEKVDPHLSGHGFCLQCKHEWAAVAPVGTTRLECPKCGTHQGVWRGTFEPEPDQHVWTCSCGNDLFIIQPHRVMCAACGTTGHPVPPPPPPVPEPVPEDTKIVPFKPKGTPSP